MPAPKYIQEARLRNDPDELKSLGLKPVNREFKAYPFYNAFPFYNFLGSNNSCYGCPHYEPLSGQCFHKST